MSRAFTSLTTRSNEALFIDDRVKGGGFGGVLACTMSSILSDVGQRQERNHRTG